MKRVFVLGHFGGTESNSYDGQTVKTKSIYVALSNQKGIELSKVDTYLVRISKFLFLKEFLKALFTTSNCIVLLSLNGMKLLFPILYLYTFFGGKVFHYVIGGRLTDLCRQNSLLKLQIKRFKKNWVESKIQAQELRDLGVVSAEYLPNFKNIQVLDEDQVNYPTSSTFCIFSRVVKEKGIADAIRAVTNARKDGYDCFLDIYGPISKEFDQEFNSLLRKSEGVFYKGIVAPEDSVDVLKKYFMLLYPSTWPGEGMPGTVIDALSSGLPIIAKRWRFCSEILQEGKTALIYEQQSELELLVKYAIEHKDLINKMRTSCLIKAREYDKNLVVSKIVNAIEGE